MVIGRVTTECLKDLDEEAKAEFFVSVRSYHVECCSYIVAKFPLQEEWLKHAEVLDPSRRKHANFESVVFFIDKLMKCDVDVIEHQFLRYLVDTLNVKAERIDEKWDELKDRSPLLFEIMFAILTIPRHC